ncbi:MAG: hypothetical protein AAFR65_03270 [Pseudomonadota bacterium]
MPEPVFPRTETTAQHWTDLMRLGSALEDLAEAAGLAAQNIRIAAAWVDRGGDPASDQTLDGARDILAEAHRILVLPYLAASRESAAALRTEHANLAQEVAA